MDEKGYRRATAEDISGVSAIYEKIHDAEETGVVTIGWERGVYPVEETARAALKKNELFVYEAGGRILAAAIINKTQVDVYEKGNWRYEAADDEVMVLHTLVVDLDAGRGGIGSGFVKFYEPMPENADAACFESTPMKKTVQREECTRNSAISNLM